MKDYYNNQSSIHLALDRMGQIRMNKAIFSCFFLSSLIALGGCAWRAAQTPASIPPPSATEVPPQAAAKPSSSPIPGDQAASANAIRQGSDSQARPGPTPGSTPNAASVQANLNRLFLERPATEKFAGSAISPGGEKLLNPKAAQFAQFTRPLLHQLFLATEDLERHKLAKRGVPVDAGPVVIEATMNKDGQLTELVIEQSSGSGVIDQTMIQACKAGLWTRNPPPEALAADGNYRFRIEANIHNYMQITEFSDWMFRTHLGMALE